MRSGVRHRGAVVAVRLAAVLLLCLSACSSADSAIDVIDAADGPADLLYEIPVGYGDLVDAGEGFDILPAELRVEVGDVIEIVNQDDRGHLIGFFFVGANETVRHQFVSPGVFEGTCTVHSSGEISVIVT